MKVKKSEIQLLIAVLGVLLVVVTYFLVYANSMSCRILWKVRICH